MFTILITFALLAPAEAPKLDVAPLPRAAKKKCEAAGTGLCLCPDGELACKARAAIAMAKPQFSTSRKPSTAEVEAAKKALTLPRK